MQSLPTQPSNLHVTISCDVSSILQPAIFLLTLYIIFAFNSNVFGNDKVKTLKVGLLAPLSGPYKEIGNSLMNSLQLALGEINNKNVTQTNLFSNKNIVVVVIHSTPPSHCQGGQLFAATWLIKLYHENTSHNTTSFY